MGMQAHKEVIAAVRRVVVYPHGHATHDMQRGVNLCVSHRHAAALNLVHAQVRRQQEKMSAYMCAYAVSKQTQHTHIRKVREITYLQ